MTELPKRLGRYQILAELGRGAMGAVYRALDPTIEREVAIKTIALDLPARELAEYRERFFKEARAAGRLSHPNIVTIFDAGEENGVAYIVMEYLTGASLRDLMTAGTPLPVEVWTTIAIQVAEGLAHAHAAGVVHRDVKPANIMLDESGRVRITDFGIARSGGTTTTQHGMVIGSPKYMSPEQIQGMDVDQRSDLFALGVVMYEMATGRPPFGAGARDVYAVMREIVGTAPRPPSAVNPELPPSLEDTIVRALAKRMQERPRSATILARELREAVLRARPGAAADALEITGRFAQPLLAARASADPAAQTELRARPASDRAAGGPAWDDVRTRLLADIDAFAASDAPIEAPPTIVPMIARADAARANPFPAIEGEPAAPPADAAVTASSGLLQQLANAAGRVRGADDAGRVERATPEVVALDAEMRRLFSYLNELVRHLNTLKPAIPRVYELAGVGAIKGLEWQRGFADYRTRSIGGTAVITRLTLRWTLAGAGHFDAERDAAAAQKMRSRLFESGLRYVEEEIRNARGLVERVRFRIFFEVNAAAAFTVDEQARHVRLAAGNLERFGRVDYRLVPDLLGTELYDEFAKLVLGAPSRFFAFAEFADAEPLKR